MSGGAGKSVGDEATRVQPSNLFPDEDKDEVVQYLRSPGRRLPVLTIEQRGATLSAPQRGSQLLSSPVRLQTFIVENGLLISESAAG